MSTATAQFTCEVCDEPLKYKGGPYKPRRCPEHQEPAAKRRRAERQANPKRKRKICQACEAELRKCSPSGLCLFCEIEMGMTEPL